MIKKMNNLFFVIFLSFMIKSSHAQCSSTQFQCTNDQCIDLNAVCDFVDDCGDGSDEQRHLTGFKCPIGRKREICVLPQHHVNDSIPQCANNADLCEVDGVQRCHKCLTTDMIISPFQLCDGVIDCPDTSDECLCETTEASVLCEQMQPSQMFSCHKATRIHSSQICDGEIHCDDLMDEKFCRANPRRNEIIRCPTNRRSSNTVTVAMACDGRLECDDFSDECAERCGEEPPICSALKSNGIISCSVDRNITTSARDVCDGRTANCSEPIYDELNCSSRFVCNSPNEGLISIDGSLACNGNPECSDGSDELNCGTRFYCENSDNPISVPTSYIMDGRRDCLDGSDECPAFLDEQLYSSREHLSSRPEITIWLWIMAVAGIVGNVLVFSYTLRKLTRSHSLTSISKTNYILILNLNVADFLTAVYLLVIGIKNTEYAGSYCEVDLQWRTSAACNFLGSFAIFSAEASLLMLTLMTTQRLHSVYDPINSSTIRKRWITLGIAMVWIISALIALIPSLLPGIFVERYWIESKYFDLPLVRLPTFHDFFRRLTMITEAANSTAFLTRFDFRAYLNTNYPQFAILGDFGYYSENSVCIPHFYVPAEDNGSFYPTIIVSINMVAFVYVAIAYYFIYRLSSRSNIRTNRDDSRNTRVLQRRITKLVSVNFIVWLPICIASYVQLGIPTEFSDALFVITAVVLFPINSVLNPLLYSDVFEKSFAKVKKHFKKPFQSNDSSASTQTTTPFNKRKTQQQSEKF